MHFVSKLNRLRTRVVIRRESMLVPATLLVLLISGYLVLDFITPEPTMHTRMPSSSSNPPPAGATDDHNSTYWHTVLQQILPREHMEAIFGNKKTPSYDPQYKNPCVVVKNKTLSGTAGGLLCLPYFYHLGVARSATTMLTRQLKRHPQVVSTTVEEQHIWDMIFTGLVSFDKYVNLYTNATSTIAKSVSSSGYHNKVTVDSTPSYFSMTSTWSRYPDGEVHDDPASWLAHLLYELNPSAKLVVNIRNPIDRFHSNYIKPVHGWSPSEFHKEVELLLELARTCNSRKDLHTCAWKNSGHLFNPKIAVKSFYRSIYHIFVRKWLKVFPREQMYFVKSEELTDDPLKVTKDVFKFLELDDAPSSLYHEIVADIDQYHRIKSSTHNISDRSVAFNKGWSIWTARETKMWNSTRKMLNEFFQPHNEALAQLLGDKKWLFL